MISLELLKACENPGCTRVLPADPARPYFAGFNATRREDGTVEFEGLCKPCAKLERRRATTAKPGGVKHMTRDVFRDCVLVKVKDCHGCGEEKICEDGPESEFPIAARRPAVTWHPLCKRCRNEAHQERKQSDPEYAAHVRERQKINRELWAQKEENREKIRAASRKYWRRIRKEDPERIREWYRMGYALRRMREGKEVRHRWTVIDGVRPRISAGPFKAWLGEYGRQWRYADNSEQIALSLHLPQRTIYRVLYENLGQVEIDLVSRALTNAPNLVELDGRIIATIDDLYPEGLPRA